MMHIRSSIKRINNLIFNHGKHVEWLYRMILKRPIILKSKDGFQFQFSSSDSFARHINRKGFTDDESVLSYIRTSLHAGDICFDVGACFGVVTLPMARLVGNNGHVYSFEAEQNNYSNLSRNIKLNNLYNVTPCNKGVFSSENGFELNVHKKEEYGDHAMRLQSENILFDSQMVETVTLDSFCDANNIKYIDLLKIDVEGLEVEVLNGGKKLLMSNSIKRIIFEVSERLLNNYGRTINDLVSVFIEYGYTIHMINNDGSLGTQMTEFPDTDFDNWVAVSQDYSL